MMNRVGSVHAADPCRDDQASIMQKSHVAIAAALACAFGLGWLTKEALADSKEPTLSGPPAAGRETSAPAPERPALEADSGKPVLADPQAPLRAAFGALPRVERERGVGRISGQVRSASGEPLAGATVRLTAQEVPGAQTAADFEGRVLTHAADLRWLEAHSYATETDAEGRYRFEELPRVRFALTAERAGYRFRPAPRQADPTRIAPPAIIDWLGDPAVQIPFEVVDAQGRPLTEALIQARRIERPFPKPMPDLRWSSAQPALTFGLGTYEIWASALHAPRDAAAEHCVRREVRAADSPTPLRLVVPETGTLDLTLLHQGQPITASDLKLACIEVPTGRSPDVSLLTADHFRMGRSIDSAAQAYPHLPYGTYVLGLGKRFGSEVLAWRTLEFRTPQMSLEWPIELDPAVKSIQVLARDERGRGIPGLEFIETLATGPRGYGGGGPLQPLIEQDGLYTCIFSRPEPTELEGRFRVTTQHPIFGEGVGEAPWPLTGPIEIAWSTYIDFTLELEGVRPFREERRIALVVERYQPTKVATRISSPRTIALSQFDDEERVLITGEASGDIDVRLVLEVGGSSIASGLPLGRIRPSLEHPHAKLRMPPIQRLQVDAKPGVLFPDRLVLCAPGTTEALFSGVARVGEPTIDFLLVPEGHYDLRNPNARESYTRMQLHITGPLHIAWSPDQPDALQLLRVHPDGMYAHAGLLEDDLILAVDGADLASLALRDVEQQIRAGRTPLTLLIRRGNQVITHFADFPAARKKAGIPGGRLEFAKR